MANVLFKKGLCANLPASYTAGTFYVTTDERAMYLDVDGSTRIRLCDFQEFATLDALKANVNPSTTAMYYVDDLNVLAKWNGSEYIQINPDTGVTSVEVIGEGNAVTDASYDVATRKLTLTRGETFATKAEHDALAGKVGEVPEGSTVMGIIANIQENAYDDTEIRGLIDKKVDKVEGKSLVADTEITKLAGVSEGANKVEASETNGNIKIDGIETTVYTHPAKHSIADVEGLQDALDGKQGAGEYAAEEHNHTKADITDFEHTHASSEITDLDATIKAYDYATKAEAQAMADGKDEAIAAAKKAGDDAQATADSKVASVTAGDASVTIGGTATTPTVAAKLSADADNAITLADDGLKVVIPAAAEYSIAKAADSGDYAAVYNLTKDGEIVGASINIPKDMVVESGSVVENPEGQAEGTYIKLVLQNVAEPLYINVGNLIEYVTSGSTAGDMVIVNVSDDHKVTATITDGTITLAKLTTDVQTAIGKAHSHENKDVLDGINADKVVAWDAAEQNAKDYADGLNAAMDTRVKVLEAIDHEAYKAADTALKTELQGEIDADVKVVSDALAQYKTDNDAAVALKANAADVYAKTETYTKDEVDAAVSQATEWGSF